jgi:hypothetical protein
LKIDETKDLEGPPALLDGKSDRGYQIGEVGSL